jgi:ADP-heptose:LPS heptosyltransferase
MCDAQELCDGGLVPLAAIISQLDLVLTVDTLAAHLAGAMNIPVWVMLQHEADWRWMIGRDDSPWYPSMRLFRQLRQGAWADAVANVEDALEKWRPNAIRQHVA